MNLSLYLMTAFALSLSNLLPPPPPSPLPPRLCHKKKKTLLKRIEKLESNSMSLSLDGHFSKTGNFFFFQPLQAVLVILVSSSDETRAWEKRFP